MQENNEATGNETPSNAESRRPSLAERLMSPDRAPPREAPAPSADAPPPSRPAPRPAGRQAALGAMTRSAPSVDDALREARGFIRVRYFIFLASVLVLFLVATISAVVLGVSLISDTSWEQQVASGIVAATALLLLILIQYRPAGSFASAAVELSQLEALRAHLEKSYGLWDEFLEERERNREVTSNDVALAVSSMTSATKELVAVQAAFMTPPRRGPAQPAQRIATPTMPDPRRY